MSFWNFPHCIGALDGKHINFIPLCSSGSYYRNYKGTDSIILLALVDANYKFIWINVGANGRTHDAAVYRESNLKCVLESDNLNLPSPRPLPGSEISIPYVIIADDAFPLGPHLMKPYSSRGLSNEQRIANYRLSRARRVVENSFGLLSNKFRILLTKIHLSPPKVELIAKTCCVLYNFIRNRSPVLDIINDEETQDLCQMKSIYTNQGGNRSINMAYIIRDEFLKYFNGPGKVPWQQDAIEKGNF